MTAPNPVLSTIKYFRNEYEAHIIDKKCPAAVCKDLIKYFILEEVCRGCGACKRVCPADAIRGIKKKPHRIDPALCIKCGTCFYACKFKAVSKS
jgi:ferredoxin